MKKLCFIFCFLCCAITFGQEYNLSKEGMSVYEGNYSTFRDLNPVISDELKSLTPIEYQSHSEFGILPYGSPCENCDELLQYRTDTTRMFVERGTNGTKFYSQSIFGDFLVEHNGEKHSINPQLQKSTETLYTSKNQINPTFLDLTGENTGFEIGNQKFVFNNELMLTLVMQDESEVTLGLANWGNRTIGEDGIVISNAWENIDIEIAFFHGKIKSNYIIKALPGYLFNVKFLKFSDKLILPEGYSIIEGENEIIDAENNRFGNLLITNSSNQTQFEIEGAYGFDQSGLKTRAQRFYYQIEENNMNLLVPQSWITSLHAEFPLIIDPQVTSTATHAAVVRFRFNGSYCGGGNADCAYNLTVARPVNSTITGTTFSNVYTTTAGSCFFACYLEEAAFSLQTTCGIDGYFSCFPAPSPGTCTATNINVFPVLGSCLGAACSGNVNFTLRTSYCYCNVNGNCGNSCHSMAANSWSVTLIGTNLQTLGNTVTGNGSQTISPITCSGTTNLNPLPTFGVPGFTYAWSTGATTPTTTVPSFGSSPVTCTVTDACGVSRVATFTIICPLGVDYKFISVNKKTNRSVEVEWETIEEKDNDYFTIFKSMNGIEFEKIGVISSKGIGDFNYSFVDQNSSYSDILYYKLMNTSLSGESETSTIFKVDFNDSETDLTIVPNPTNGLFHLKYTVPYTDVYTIELVDTFGKIISRTESELKIGNAFLPYDLRNYPKGIYTVSIRNKTNTVKQRVVIQ